MSPPKNPREPTRLEMILSPSELKACSCIRSRIRVQRHFRTGEIRKAKDKYGCSLDCRIMIIGTSDVPEQPDKLRISFIKVNR